jgi:LytS/YehU family sensor histidine kinase
VPLRRELEYLQLYLSIEQVRFQDRLRVEITADPNILDAAVPQMALQPIVENAVRHGIGRSSSAGRITISASRANDTLELRVQDDGPGFPSQGSVGDDSLLNKGTGWQRRVRAAPAGIHISPRQSKRPTGAGRTEAIRRPLARTETWRGAGSCGA